MQSYTEHTSEDEVQPFISLYLFLSRGTCTSP